MRQQASGCWHQAHLRHLHCRQEWSAESHVPTANAGALTHNGETCLLSCSFQAHTCCPRKHTATIMYAVSFDNPVRPGNQCEMSVRSCLDFVDIAQLTMPAHEGGVGVVVGPHPQGKHVLQHIVSCSHVPLRGICSKQCAVAHHVWSNAKASHFLHCFASSAAAAAC